MTNVRKKWKKSSFEIKIHHGTILYPSPYKTIRKNELDDSDPVDNQFQSRKEIVQILMKHMHFMNKSQLLHLMKVIRNDSVLRNAIVIVSAASKSVECKQDCDIVDFQGKATDRLFYPYRQTLFSEYISVIDFNIFSNWGHPSKLGLTEIRFFNWKGYTLTPSMNKCRFNQKQCSQLSLLFNEEVLDESFMWSCDYHIGNVVSLQFVIEGENSRIGAIKVWNYHNTEELDAGIKELCILVNKDVFYDGLLHRASQNKDADYGYVIYAGISLCPENSFAFSENVKVNEANSFIDPLKRACKNGRARSAIVNRLKKQNQHFIALETNNKNMKIPYGKRNNTINTRSRGRSCNFLLEGSSSSNKMELFCGSMHFIKKGVNFIASYKSASDSNECFEDSSFIQAFEAGIICNKSPTCNSTDSCNSELIFDLPVGHLITFNLLSTWGDKYYIGLTGVEIFGSDGFFLTVEKIWANPSNKSILKEQEIITNLLDGINETTDGTHMWVAPFIYGSNHIYFELNGEKGVSVIRIWNYNESEIYSCRGVRSLEILLDDVVIFRGELKKGIETVDKDNILNHPNTILFTTNEKILLPILGYFSNCKNIEKLNTSKEISPNFMLETRESFVDLNLSKECNQTINYCSEGTLIRITLLMNWSHPEEIGLTIISDKNEEILINNSNISIETSSFHKNWNGIERLFNGIHLTCDHSYMWSAPFNPAESYTLSVCFRYKCTISKILVWNYNGPGEAVTKGVKYIKVEIDGSLISPEGGFLIRPAPGHMQFNYAQKLDLLNPFISTFASLHQMQFLESHCKKTEYLEIACGFVYELSLLSNWGDKEYIGLNGLEVYDVQGEQIILNTENIAAYPPCVNIFPNYNNDIRIPENLLNGINETKNKKNIWLSPILPGIATVVFIIFNQPTSLSLLRIWNYSRTPRRGVKDINIFADGVPVYNGIIKSNTNLAEPHSIMLLKSV